MEVSVFVLRQKMTLALVSARAGTRKITSLYASEHFPDNNKVWWITTSGGRGNFSSMFVTFLYVLPTSPQVAFISIADQGRMHWHHLCLLQTSINRGRTSLLKHMSPSEKYTRKSRPCDIHQCHSSSWLFCVFEMLFGYRDKTDCIINDL